MKTTCCIIILLFALSGYANGQSSYTAVNYAANGDTVYLTGASPGNFDFNTTGISFNWDYSLLTGQSQRVLTFRAPNQTGFTPLQWPYLNNSSNVNTSSTDGETIQAGTINYTNPNDYFLKSASALEQRASSYKISIGNTSVTIKNVYTSPDVLYKFPLNYQNKDSSLASYTISISNLYYNASTIKRVNNIDGWGTLTTPYGTFGNCLRLVSTITQTDTIAIDSMGLPSILTQYKEIQWLDPSGKYPLLTVVQNKIGNTYVTQKVEYYDVKKYFQPTALFVYYPLAPLKADTVTFQNLSTNSSSYTWDFGDPASGTSNTSTLQNPTHIFGLPGIYQVRLIVFNGPYSDTMITGITITEHPQASFTYLPAVPAEDDIITFINTSSNASSYTWDFGDPASGTSNTSAEQNPSHCYTSGGTYEIQLIAQNGTYRDTLRTIITVIPLVAMSVRTEASENIQLYPNPASEDLYLLTPFNGALEISIKNNCGQTLRYEKHENVEEVFPVKIDLSAFTSGIYYLFIDSGDLTDTHKIIISK